MSPRTKIKLLLELREYDDSTVRSFAILVQNDPLNDYEINVNGSINEIVRDLKSVELPLLEMAWEKLFDSDDVEEEQSEVDYHDDSFQAEYGEEDTEEMEEEDM